MTDRHFNIQGSFYKVSEERVYVYIEGEWEKTGIPKEDVETHIQAVPIWPELNITH